MNEFKSELLGTADVQPNLSQNELESALDASIISGDVQGDLSQNVVRTAGRVSTQPKTAMNHSEE